MAFLPTLLKGIGGPNSLGQVRYKPNPDGTVSTLNPPARNGGSNDRRLGYQASPPEVDSFLNSSKDYPYTSPEEAKTAAAELKTGGQIAALREEFNKKLSDRTEEDIRFQNALGATYASDFTRDLLKNPVAPTLDKALNKEKFFYDIYKPSIGGDAGVLSFFENISGAGSPNVPDYNQFLAGSGSWRHNRGKTYELKGVTDTKKPFEEAYKNYQAEIDAKNAATQKTYETELGYTETARQLADLSNVSRINQEPVNAAVQSLSAARNFGASDYATQLNFQVSDDQIIQDLNASKIARLNNVVQTGNAQIVGIRERIDEANKFIGNLKAGDPRRTVSEKAIATMTSDLASVTSAIQSANEQIKNYVPVTLNSPEGLKDVTSFRSFLQLPEERASQQLRQIDPESYQTSVTLGQKYRQMAEAPIGATTTPETEALRQRIEGEAMAQLSLGAQLGAEEQRAYQQAARGAQTARGNIFGVAPAVEEAVTTGAAGEQRKLARYGAAAQFLGSGQTTGDALKADLAFRDALQQNRLGAASNFIAGGPSIYNLSQARTGQQQAAFQNYIQANQALPGGFNQQPSTAAPFYQAVDQSIPVALTQAFNDLYRSQASYLSDTYGAQVGAISRQPNGFQNFATAAGGFKDLAGGFGGLASAGLLCWVAREVYGEDNPKWLQFREWMLTRASDNLRNYYIEYGERIAESIRNRPKVKDIIRRWMDKKVKEMYGS